MRVADPGRQADVDRVKRHADDQAPNDDTEERGNNFLAPQDQDHHRPNLDERGHRVGQKTPVDLRAVYAGHELRRDYFGGWYGSLVPGAIGGLARSETTCAPS